jgi:hypothetical protein
MDHSLDLALVYRKRRSLPSDLHTSKLGRHTIINPPQKHMRCAIALACAPTRTCTGSNRDNDGDDKEDEEDGQDSEVTQRAASIQGAWHKSLEHSLAKPEIQDLFGHKQKSDLELEVRYY